MIRAYFALNRLLAAELLKPTSFIDVCTSIVKDGEARLAFTARVPARPLTAELVRRVALILEEQSFGDAWRKVWASACHGGGGDMKSKEPAHPLFCMPPALLGSQWEVVGIKHDSVFVVLEIKKFNFALELPFSTVSFEHPSFKEYEGGGTRPKGTQTRKDPKKIISGPLPAAPKGITRPYTVEIGSCTAGFPRPIEVVKITRVVRQGAMGSDKAHGGGVVRRKTITDLEGTLYEEAGVGELPAVEFLAFESLEDIQPVFHKR